MEAHTKLQPLDICTSVRTFFTSANDSSLVEVTEHDEIQNYT